MAIQLLAHPSEAEALQRSTKLRVVASLSVPPGHVVSAPAIPPRLSKPASCAVPLVRCVMPQRRAYHVAISER